MNRPPVAVLWLLAAAGDAGGPAEVAQTEFDVVMTGFGDKKLDVVKLVKKLNGPNTLMEAKKIVEAPPATIKEKVDKEEAEKVKSRLGKRLVPPLN